MNDAQVQVADPAQHPQASRLRVVGAAVDSCVEAKVQLKILLSPRATGKQQLLPVSLFCCVRWVQPGDARGHDLPTSLLTTLGS
eukprot:COSAG05_NODE_760_length_7489_cov_1.989716_4_plen_84_part_00